MVIKKRQDLVNSKTKPRPTYKQLSYVTVHRLSMLLNYFQKFSKIFCAKHYFASSAILQTALDRFIVAV